MRAKRLFVALILLPLFYLYIMKLAEGYFFALLLVAALVAQWELYSMFGFDGLMKTLGIFSGAAVLLTAHLSRDLYPQVLMLSLMVVTSVRLLAGRNPSNSLRDTSVTLFPLLYIPGLLAFQLYLRENGPEWIIFLFGCVWISDSFAYYIGKGVGGRKLYKEVSPNKTIAGAFGSLIGGLLSGWLLNLAVFNRMSLGQSIAVGAIMGAVTVIGDLVESMFKRDAGVKDSSVLIPGHGGVLDKIDGVLFGGPVLYWFSLGLGLIK